MADLGRCGDCKHWKSPEAVRAELKALNGDYKLPHGRCLKIVYTGWETDRTTMVAHLDNCGCCYGGDLGTLPMFGCILWEKKDG